MNKTLRRMLCLVLVLVFVASMSAPAFAAVKPSATLSGTSKRTVRIGRTCSLKFYLHSGSYTRTRGYFRARFDTDMYRDTGDPEGTRVAYTNYVYFTGNPSLTVRYTFNKTKYPQGLYYLRYRTEYRTSVNTNIWNHASSRWAYFKAVKAI